MFLSQAAHILDSTPDELCSLDLGRIATAIEHGTISVDVARSELAERRRRHQLVARPEVTHVGSPYTDPGTINTRITRATHGDIRGRLDLSVDLVENEPPGLSVHIDTPDGDLHLETLQQLRDTIATLELLDDAWTALQPEQTKILENGDTSDGQQTECAA